MTFRLAKIVESIRKLQAYPDHSMVKDLAQASPWLESPRILVIVGKSHCEGMVNLWQKHECDRQEGSDYDVNQVLKELLYSEHQELTRDDPVVDIFRIAGYQKGPEPVPEPKRTIRTVNEFRYVD